MTSVEDVLAQLKTVIAEIDQAAVAVMRAKAHVTDAHASFTEAGTGTQDTDMRSAITGADTGGKDLRKAAVLLTQAIQDFADYADTIAPGSGLGGNTDDVLPSGERMVREADEGEAGFAAFARRTTHASDEVREKVKGLADFVQKVGGRHSGGTTTTTSTPQPPSTQSPPTAGDHAGNLVVVGLAAAVAAKRIRDKIREWRRSRHGQPS